MVGVLREVAYVSALAAALTLAVFLVSLHTVFAALLYVDPPTSNVYRGDTVTLSLRIDTDEDECINTVDGVIKYDPSIRAVDVSRGESILSVWVEDPVIDEANQTITFAGGIPGGYCGRIPGDPSLTNTIVELVFRSPGLSVGGSSNPEAGVRIDEATQVLLHDGFGTRAPLRTHNAVVTLLDSIGPAPEDTWSERVSEDTTPPADFSIALTKEESAFSGNYFITWNTQDKQSGIDHYEVMEEPFDEFDLFKWGAADAPWSVAKSPYVLKDQSLNSTIRVRAIDKAGNETIAVLVPDQALRTLSMERVLTYSAVGLIALVILGLGGFALWRRKQQLVKEYEHPDVY